MKKIKERSSGTELRARIAAANIGGNHHSTLTLRPSSDADLFMSRT